MDVSGITGTVVHFDFGWPLGKFKGRANLRLTLQPDSTNYLGLLGLPLNTVFVKRRYTRPPSYEVHEPPGGIMARTNP